MTLTTPDPDALVKSLTSDRPISLFDYEARAKELLPGPIWDFIAGGVLDEVTLRRNRAAFEELALNLRPLRDVSNRRLETTVLGTRISLPVVISPAGVHRLAHEDGEVETARGAELSDTLMIAAVRADRPIEEVAASTTAPLWFQLKYFGKRTTADLVRRAEAAGCRAIVLTVDSLGDLNKERDIRNGFLDLGALGFGTANVPASVADQPADLEPATWETVTWLREIATVPIVLKGITTAEDAATAVENGVAGIVVSNHGGRVMDTMPAAIEMLPGVVAAVDGRAEVYLDSGVRRGSDVLKALALGARAVGIGRPLYWGLAVGGAAGVHRVIEILRAELDGNLACCGQQDVAALDPTVVSPSATSGLSR